MDLLRTTRVVRIQFMYFKLLGNTGIPHTIQRRTFYRVFHDAHLGQRAFVHPIHISFLEYATQHMP